MVFSTNQNRHFYVATALNQSSHRPNVTSNGDLGIGTIGTGNEKEFYFVSKNLTTGEVIKSDNIAIKNLTYVKAVSGASMEAKLKKVEVTLNSTPIAGQDYLMRINFKQFYGMSDEDQYLKDVVVHVTSAIDNAKKFFDAMKAALDMAFSREVGATATSNPYLAFSVSGSGSSAKLVIEEKPQEWTLGTQAQERVYFDVFPTTIYTGGDDVIWGTVTDVTSSNTNTLKNGKKIADLEWFCMGERGDQYRYNGWPNYIPTAYSVNPANVYSLIELHFAFTDEGVNSYRSEKDITIAVPDGAVGSVYTAINAIIDEIEYATGLTIPGLSE